MNNNDVVIIDGCRTAVGNMGGTLKSIPAVDLATVCLKGIIDRTGVDASQIDDVILDSAVRHQTNRTSPE
jgi:acetyl-CoA C-acetyltransferase